MRTHSKHGERGYILLSVYFLGMLLTIISLGLFSRHFFFLQNTERNQNRIVAFNMADAGGDRAIASLGSDINYGGSGGYAGLGSRGGYSVSVCPPTCPTGTTQPTDSKVRLIQSSGFSPSNVTTVRAYETRSLQSYVKLDTTPFKFAAFGDQSLILNGTPYVDSYNSANGAYGASNNGSNGDISSDGSISFIGNPTVKGATIQSPDISCSPASTALPSSGALKIQGSQNYQLAAGTYHFDSISITGNGKLTLLGPVTIYVDGDVYVGGNGVATSSNLPANFMLYATGSHTITLAGTSKFYAAVYAPAAPVQYTGTQDFYGAVIGNAYQQSGTSSLHYDIALKDVTAPCTKVTLLSWRELNTVSQ